MNIRGLLVLALVACIAVTLMDAKSLGKHKKHGKKHHVKHAKKADSKSLPLFNDKNITRNINDIFISYNKNFSLTSTKIN